MTSTKKTVAEVTELINRWVEKEKITTTPNKTSSLPYVFLKPRKSFEFIDELQKIAITKNFSIFKGIIVMYIETIETDIKLVIITE